MALWAFEITMIMKQSDEGIRLIQASFKKLELKWSDGIFSFEFSGNFFIKQKSAAFT